jgi:hypothetical protein
MIIKAAEIPQFMEVIEEKRWLIKAEKERRRRYCRM